MEVLKTHFTFSESIKKWATLLSLNVFLTAGAVAQMTFGTGFLIGGANYSGDLSGDEISSIIAQTLPSAGILFELSPTPSIKLRSQISISAIQGADRLSTKTWQKERNLDFRSTIFEGALIGELHILKWLPQASNWISSPYLFGGVAFFSFNPRTKYKGEWIDLQPLGTEGQGLAAYPEKTPYDRTSFSFPVGAGWEIALNESVTVALELGWRWTLTDYLDDLSGTYADYETLRIGNGDLAALMAYRFHEISGINEPYPFGEGSIRGNPDVNDIYAMGVLKVVYHWNNKYSNVYKSPRKRRRKAMKCPSF
jgi:hypothetical protein